jgi:hypothetical protein
VQIAGPAVTLNDADTAYPYFTAPFVSAAGETLKFALTVDDGFGGTSMDTAFVTVNNVNEPPNDSNIRPSISVLWPPNHRMVLVSLIGVVANHEAKVTITGVTQDEPTSNGGRGRAKEKKANKDGKADKGKRDDGKDDHEKKGGRSAKHNDGG